MLLIIWFTLKSLSLYVQIILPTVYLYDFIILQLFMSLGNFALFDMDICYPITWQIYNIVRGKTTYLIDVRVTFFLLYIGVQLSSASLVSQTVGNPPAVRETWVQSLGWEDPLEEGMAIHSSILAWRIPRTEEPGGLQSMGSHRVRHDWATNTQHTTLKKF